MVADLLPRQRRTGLLELEGSVFVGRRQEIVALALAVGRSRLTTVTGEAGVGKTRLALRHAAASRAGFDSVWFCDLRDARDVEAMSAALARALSIADEANVIGDAAVTAVGRALAARGRALVVLDNLDPGLREGAGVVLAWLDLAKDARIVVTSRAPLGLLGEEQVALGPLALPGGEGAEGDAVGLFVARVRAMKQGFTPSGDEARAIAEVVRRVRGVPLAIELCASRFSSQGAASPWSLSPRAALPGGLPRLASLADPIAWSFHKLDPDEREALAQCSVFHGGFTLEAAERVVELPSDIDARWVQTAAQGRSMPDRIGGVLATLVQKGLLQPLRRGDDGDARFALCEAIRAHALGQLDESVEGAGAPWRHARCYLALATGPLTDLPEEPGAARTREALVAERANLEAVLAFGAAGGRRDIVLRAALALDVVSSGTGLGHAQLAALDAALAIGGNLDPDMVGRALGVRAGALRALGRLEEAERDARTALRLAEAASSSSSSRPSRQVVAMHLALGGACFQLGALEDALAHSQAAATAARAGGHRVEEPLALQQVGAVLQCLGEPEEARIHYEAALSLAIERGDEVAEARASMGLGSWHLEMGDADRAEAFYDRGLLIARRRGMARSVRIVMGYLGVLHFDAGRLQEAERWLDSAARASRAVGDLRIEGFFEGLRGAVLASLDLTEEARRAFLLAGDLLRANPYFFAVIEVHRGHLDLAEAREAQAEGTEEGEALAGVLRQAAALRVEEAEGRRGDAPPLVRRSDDARIAVRILRRALAG